MASGTCETPSATSFRKWLIDEWGLFRAFLFVVLVIAAIAAIEKEQFCLDEYPWGGWKRPLPEKGEPTRPKKWKNLPTLKLENPAERVSVLIELLKQNREEVRFVQGLLFTTAFWFTAAIGGIVSFNLGKKGDHPRRRGVSVVGCLLLCWFFFLFARFAEGAMVINHDDLIGIQYALRLSGKGEYLADQVIYQEGDYGAEDHIKPLVTFFVVAVVLAVGVLLFLRGLPEGEKTEAK